MPMIGGVKHKRAKSPKRSKSPKRKSPKLSHKDAHKATRCEAKTHDGKRCKHKTTHGKHCGHHRR